MDVFTLGTNFWYWTPRWDQSLSHVPGHVKKSNRLTIYLMILSIHCDSQEAIAIVNNWTYNSKSRRVDQRQNHDKHLAVVFFFFFFDIWFAFYLYSLRMKGTVWVLINDYKIAGGSKTTWLQISSKLWSQVWIFD